MRRPHVAVGNTQLVQVVQSATQIKTHHQRLGWAEPPPTIQQLSQRNVGDSFGHHEYELLSAQHGFAPVKGGNQHRVRDTRHRKQVTLKLIDCD